MLAHRNHRNVVWKPLFHLSGAKRRLRPVRLQMTGTVGMRALTYPIRLASRLAMRHQNTEALRPFEEISPCAQHPTQVLLGFDTERSLTTLTDSPKWTILHILQVIHDNSVHALSKTMRVFQGPSQVG